MDIEKQSGESMTDPHSNDYCVVCKQDVEIGVTMHPITSIENGHVCQACINSASKHFVGRP